MVPGSLLSFRLVRVDKNDGVALTGQAMLRILLQEERNVENDWISVGAARSVELRQDPGTKPCGGISSDRRSSESLVSSVRDRRLLESCSAVCVAGLVEMQVASQALHTLLELC